MTDSAPDIDPSFRIAADGTLTVQPPTEPWAHRPFPPDHHDVTAARAFAEAIASVTRAYLEAANSRAAMAGDEHGTAMRAALRQVGAELSADEAACLMHTTAALRFVLDGVPEPADG